MNRENRQTLGGLSLPTALFLVFLILRLCHVIDWSWWWVTSPLWIFAAIIIGLTVIYMLVYAIRLNRRR